jgi:type 1 fimbriae regulatory protein FimE
MGYVRVNSALCGGIKSSSLRVASMSPGKNGMPSVHPLSGAELRALRRLQREQEDSRYVFLSERGAPLGPPGFRRMVARLGLAAKISFQVHPHMLRHGCGYKLANQGVDTRSLQHPVLGGLESA